MLMVSSPNYFNRQCYTARRPRCETDPRRTFVGIGFPHGRRSKPLLLSRRFAPLFWCQFFSAFSDNFLKNALVFLILFKIGGGAAESLITLAAAVFIAPYFFLSALGGEIADRYDKAIVAQRLKLVEIGVALIAIAGFVLHSVPILFVALFGFGVIGSLFGPIKYGILPDLLPRSELPAANALVEGATFMAILLGTIVGGLAAKGGGDPASFAGLMLVFALLCWGSSLFIPRVGSGAPDLKITANIAASTAGLLKHLRSDQPAVVGRAGDELVLAGRRGGAVAAAAAGEEHARRHRGGRHRLSRGVLGRGGDRLGPRGLARQRPHRDPADAGRRGAARRCSRSISAGPPMARRWRWRRPASARCSLSALGLRVMIDLAGLAIAGGLYIVPAFAAVQAWAGADRRARVIAARQRAQRRVHGRRHHRGRGAAGVRRSARRRCSSCIGLATLVVAIAIARTMPANR